MMNAVENVAMTLYADCQLPNLVRACSEHGVFSLWCYSWVKVIHGNQLSCHAGHLCRFLVIF